MARLNWVGIPLGWHPGEAGTGRVPEDRVPVGVAGDGYAAAPEQALHQQEVAVGVFPLGEAGVNHRTGGIIHRDQQRERRRLVSQPWVMTAVQLDQHALPRHALAAHPVLGRTPSSWTAQTGVDQDAPQGGPADVDALALAQQLAEMGVVGPCVPGTSQTHYAGHQASGVALAGLRPRWPWVREAADRVQLVLPVATTILAGRDGQSSRPPASACADTR